MRFFPLVLLLLVACSSATKPSSPVLPPSKAVEDAASEPDVGPDVAKDVEPVAAAEVEPLLPIGEICDPEPPWPLDPNIEVVEGRKDGDGDPVFGFRDKKTRRVLIAPRYDIVEFGFNRHGVAIVLSWSKGYVYIDKTGKELAIAAIFDNGPYPFWEGLAQIQKDGKLGFVDATGKVVIEPVWDGAGRMCSARARVCQGCKLERHMYRGGTFGYIDASGKIVVPLEFDDASEFDKDGRARVRKGDRTWIIDTNGNPVQ